MKTDMFMHHMKTAEDVQRVAAERNIRLTLRQAHECWEEHSDDYCAGWLVYRDNDKTGEILEALTKYQARHKA